MQQHVDKLNAFLRNSKLAPDLVLQLLKEKFKKREMDQFDQVFENASSDDLAIYIQSLQAGINQQQQKMATEAKKAKGTASVDPKRRTKNSNSKTSRRRTN